MISNDRRLLLLRGLVDAEAGGGGGVVVVDVDVVVFVVLVPVEEDEEEEVAMLSPSTILLSESVIPLLFGFVSSCFSCNVFCFVSCFVSWFL